MTRAREISTHDVIQESIRIQRELIREIRAGRKLEGSEFTVIDLNNAQRALAALIHEARSLTKDAARWAGTLTQDEKRAAIVGWFADLPRRQRELLLAEMQRAISDERADA